MPVVVLIFLIAADALLKSYAPSSYYPFAFAAVVLALIYFFLYFRRRAPEKDQWEDLTKSEPASRQHIILLCLILLLGGFLRFWKLGSLFDGMTYDEAYKGLDAIAIHEFGERPIFLDWNGGREALVAYFVAASQWLFDYSSISVRFITALTGTLTLLFFYLFSRTLFHSRVALLSTFLLAVSKWHIIHTRYGVRAGLYPFFEIATLYFLARAFRSDKKNTFSFLMAAIIGALGFYTYIAYRIFPIVVVAFLFEKAIRGRFLKHWKMTAVAAVVCIVILTPLAKFYVNHSSSLTDRMKRTQVWNQKGNPAELIGRSALATIGMFTFRGDSIARHDVNEEPMLSPFLTAFFIIGAVLVIASIRRRWTVFLCTYFLVMLVPGILSVGAPNVPRNFGALPVAILFASFGLLSAEKIVALRSQVMSRWITVAILGGAFLTGWMDVMVRFPEKVESLSEKVSALWGMDRDQANVARLANALGEGCDIFVSPQFFFHSTIEYLTYSKSSHKIFTTQTDLRKESSSGKVAVILLQPHEVNPWWLRDDEGKKFAKWWNQSYGMDMRQIRMIVRKTYDPPFTSTSDWRLMEALKKRYPEGKHLRFEHFDAFVVR